MQKVVRVIALAAGLVLSAIWAPPGLSQSDKTPGYVVEDIFKVRLPASTEDLFARISAAER